MNKAVRLFFILTSVMTLAVFLAGSCSTMEAAEQQRKAKIAAQKKQEQQDKKDKTKSLEPDFSKETGSLLQPKNKSLKYDAQTAALERSVGKALAQVEANDLKNTAALAQGPVSITFKPVLKTAKELKLVEEAYGAFSEASYDVLVSLNAYGLSRNLAAIEKVRTVGAEWEKWFSIMEIASRGPGLNGKVMTDFFHHVGAARKVYESAIKGINVFIDRQRTRAFMTPVHEVSPTPAQSPAGPSDAAPAASTPSPASRS